MSTPWVPFTSIKVCYHPVGTKPKSLLLAGWQQTWKSAISWLAVNLALLLTVGSDLIPLWCNPTAFILHSVPLNCSILAAEAAPQYILQPYYKCSWKSTAMTLIVSYISCCITSIYTDSMLQVHASFILLTLWQFCRFTIILHSCCMQKTDNYHMTKINDVIRYWSDIIHTIHFCDVIGQFIITSPIAIKMANLIWYFVVKIRTFKKFVCQRFLPDTSHRYKQAQSNLNGSNIFETTEIHLRHG